MSIERMIEQSITKVRGVLVCPEVVHVGYCINPMYYICEGPLGTFLKQCINVQNASELCSMYRLKLAQEADASLQHVKVLEHSTVDLKRDITEGNRVLAMYTTTAKKKWCSRCHCKHLCLH